MYLGSVTKGRLIIRREKTRERRLHNYVVFYGGKRFYYARYQSEYAVLKWSSEGLQSSNAVEMRLNATLRRFISNLGARTAEACGSIY